MEVFSVKTNTSVDYSIINKSNEVDRSFENDDSMTEVETKKSYLLNPIHPDFPSTIFFQYDSDICKHNNTSKRRTEINWKESLLNQVTTKNESIELDNQTLQKIPNNKTYACLYKVYKNVPECITIPMKSSGLFRTKSFLDANLIWKLLKIDKMTILIKKLNKFQRYNHFPCTWQLGRKDNLWKNFKILQNIFPEDYNFIPETYIIPEDQSQFIKAFESNPEINWIVKPVASSRGRGIRLLNNLNTLPKKCLVSKYIEKPHIINNKKYDLRLYIVITSFTPLKIYLYQDGLVRFASEEYCGVNSSNKYNRYMHLTNYSVNKNSANFDKNYSMDEKFTGSKWSLATYKKYFKENNLNFENMWNKIKDIVTKAIICAGDQTISTVKKLTPHTNNLFELYGFDILIDENLNPCLLEINLNPMLNCDTDLDLKVKSSLMTDIFNLVGVIPYAHPENPNNYYDSNGKNKTQNNNYNGSSLYNNISNLNKEPQLMMENINSLKNFIINYEKNKNSEKDDLKTKIEKDEISQIEKKKETEKKTEKIIELIVEEYDKLGLEMDIDKYLNLPNIKEMIEYTIEEFSRNRNFDRCYPHVDNVEYYSKFISEPAEENIILWNWLKNKYSISGYDKVLNESDINNINN